MSRLAISFCDVGYFLFICCFTFSKLDSLLFDIFYSESEYVCLTLIHSPCSYDLKPIMCNAKWVVAETWG